MSLWLPLFPPFGCWRGWNCHHCDHWKCRKLHNLRAEAEILESVHQSLLPSRFVFVLVLHLGTAFFPELNWVVETTFFPTTISIFHEFFTYFSVKPLGTLFFLTRIWPMFVKGLADLRMSIGAFCGPWLFVLASANQKKSTNWLFLVVLCVNSFVAAGSILWVVWGVNVCGFFPYSCQNRCLVVLLYYFLCDLGDVRCHLRIWPFLSNKLSHSGSNLISVSARTALVNLVFLTSSCFRVFFVAPIKTFASNSVSATDFILLRPSSDNLRTSADPIMSLK